MAKVDSHSVHVIYSLIMGAVLGSLPLGCSPTSEAADPPAYPMTDRSAIPGAFPSAMPASPGVTPPQFQSSPFASPTSSPFPSPSVTPSPGARSSWDRWPSSGSRAEDAIFDSRPVPGVSMPGSVGAPTIPPAQPGTSAPNLQSNPNTVPPRTSPPRTSPPRSGSDSGVEEDEDGADPFDFPGLPARATQLAARRAR